MVPASRQAGWPLEPVADDKPLINEGVVSEALFDMEEPITEMRSFICILNHLTVSRNEVQPNEVGYLAVHLKRLVDQIDDLRKRAWEGAGGRA
jgi:hypothetical protein